MTRIGRLVAVGLPALLGGCGALDPYDRAYTWRPTGAGGANLAAMAANPADLAFGRGERGADGAVAASAVDRLRSGTVKPLVTGAGGAAGGSGSGGGGGGGGNGAGALGTGPSSVVAP